jgi:hypothetical protein
VRQTAAKNVTGKYLLLFCAVPQKKLVRQCAATWNKFKKTQASAFKRRLWQK